MFLQLYSVDGAKSANRGTFVALLERMRSILRGVASWLVDSEGSSVQIMQVLDEQKKLSETKERIREQLSDPASLTRLRARGDNERPTGAKTVNMRPR